MLADEEDDVAAYAVFPRNHWRKIRFTSPLERVSKEIEGRINVVGVFLNDDAVLRLIGATLAEQLDKGQTSECHYLTVNDIANFELEIR